MKKFIYMAIALAATALSSCSDDDKLPVVTPADRGTVTDDLGNQYNWVRIGDQLWTTSNAKNGTSLADAEYYTNWDWDYILSSDRDVEDYEQNYFPVHGNLLSFDEAMESAPAGWRLPSDEDWQKLEKTLGMKNTGKYGHRGGGVAYSMQQTDSGCELGLTLNGSCVPIKTYGWIEMNLDFVGEYGYYWTSTINPDYEDDATMVYFRRITANSGDVSRLCTSSACYMGVRWVKDVD